MNNINRTTVYDFIYNTIAGTQPISIIGAHNQYIKEPFMRVLPMICSIIIKILPENLKVGQPTVFGQITKVIQLLLLMVVEPKNGYLNMAKIRRAGWSVIVYFNNIKGDI